MRHAPGEPVFADLYEAEDAAESTATTYSMSIGDTFNGELSSVLDEDWVSIELTAGTTYSISHVGVSLSDPLVRLYDSTGQQIAVNDDGGAGLNSLLTYTAGTTGTYYISADAYEWNDSRSIGTYALSVTESAPPQPATEGTLDELAEYLTEGYWGGREITFDTSASNQITVNLTGLTAAGQQLARWAMEAWEMAVNLDFVEVSSGEMITMDDEESGAFAYSPNSGSSNGVELNVSRAWLTNNGTSIDSYSFQTYIHEIGHAVGLGHQGDYNGNATYGVDETFANDSWQVSVMSYFSQTENTSTNASYAYVSTLMMADILAAQNLYGAPGASTATAGNTTYGQGSNLGNYTDEIFNWIATGNTTANVTGNLMAYTIYDRDGIDTLNFEFTTNDARLDMRAEQFSDFGTLVGILGIARGTVIENAILGSGHDAVTGNVAANMVAGGAGNDLLD
ncbi:hypothetical protein RA29_21625, partial [Tateyamaria sp. ANG-S1]